MLRTDFQYQLPPELIAQVPAPRRDGSRLLVFPRSTARIEHRRFVDLVDFLEAGDVLVLNDSRVIPARLRGSKEGSGGEIEALLVEENSVNDWWVMLRPGKRVRPGTRIRFHDPAEQPSNVTAAVQTKSAEGHVRLRFEGSENILSALPTLGETPLPPYITRDDPPGGEDESRYQTVYASPPGSVAAPTAGLHFTPELLEKISDRGVIVRFVTLHVGLATFAPVKAVQVNQHTMHEERFVLPPETAEAINLAKREGRRVVAVGTTALRVLEAVAATTPSEESHVVLAGNGRTKIFIYPPYQFRVVDSLLTNFHLPESTLLMLVSAFAAPGSTAGVSRVLGAYQQAIQEEYRFFSYGDAMLML